MKYDLLSLGSGVVDKILCVDDEFIKKMKLQKGGTRNCLNKPHDYLIEASKSKKVMSISGGSAANATKVVAGLGKKCAYICKIGNDKWGDFYKKNCTERNIETLFSVSEDLPTGSILSLVTPDAERTMCSDLRACQAITGADIKKEHFSHCKLFHLDGYNFYYEDALKTAIESAIEYNCPISIDCCGHEIIRSHFDIIMQYLEGRYFHLFFANEREAFELTGRSDPTEACQLLSKFCSYATVMMGEKGSVTAHKGKLYYEHTNPIKPLDTTGAGDMYVGGFLYAYLSGLSVEECMFYGKTTAAEGIQVFGGELPTQNLQRLKKYLASLEYAKN
ncbi:MAG: putative sugar kinase YdjH [Chlamydiae bacterium]|nr:putative sugar kinase YdjH [Chlamydiota bacterium]